MRLAASAVLALAFATAGSVALAATDRPAWVEAELYRHNHPMAAAQPAELATKMTKMAASPFAFYRGTAHIFYRDMTTLPASAYLDAATGKVWLPGDMHLQNYGGIRDANGNEVFDISDFDEGYFGPYVWDVRRMAVSIQLAGRELGFSAGDRDEIVDAFVDKYLHKMDEFMGTNDEKGYRLTVGDLSNVAKDVVQELATKSRGAFLDKYTTTTGGPRLFKRTADVVGLPAETHAAVANAMPAYIASISASKRYQTGFYAVKDAVQKLGSGVGSLGRLRVWILVEGPSGAASDDVVLEMKEAGPSAVALANPGGMPTGAYGGHEGARIVLSMKAGLANTDVLVGYATVSGMPVYLKEKSPFQEDFDYTAIGSGKGAFKDTVEAMAKLLAKTHAIADQDYDATLIPYSQDKQVTDVVTSGSGFKAETRAFARDYATQVERDFAAFTNARAAGRPLY